MQYELWGRKRETKRYEFIEAFQDEQQKFYMIDKIDPEIYYEAMIVRTEWQQMPSLVMYKEYDDEYIKGQSLVLKKRRQRNELV